jgi:hypothetical protein
VKREVERLLAKDESREGASPPEVNPDGKAETDNGKAESDNGKA